MSVILLLLVRWLFLFPSFVFAFVFGNHLADEERSVFFLLFFLFLFLLLCVCWFYLPLQNHGELANQL